MSDAIPRMTGPLTPAQVADLMEIQQKIYFYGWCVDHRLFDELDALFLPDTIIHYDVPMGTKKPWSEMRGWLPAGLGQFRVTQHNMSNPMVELDGERARSRTYGQLMHFMEKKSGEIGAMRHYTIYHDEWIRRSEGWRITHRRLAHLHIDGEIPGRDVVPYPTPRPIGL